MASCPTTGAAKQVLPHQQLKAPHASAHLLWNICTTSHRPLRLPITHLGPGGAAAHSCFFSPSFPCHPPFQLPEGKVKEQKDPAGNRPGTGIYTLEKNGSSGRQGWLEGLSVHMWIAQAALSRIPAQTAAQLPFILCTVSSSPSEKHSPVGASVQQPLQPSYTKLVALAHTLLCTGFYLSSAQILISGSSSQGQPDVP